jgi:hypothetical protein
MIAHPYIRNYSANDEEIWNMKLRLQTGHSEIYDYHSCCDKVYVSENLCSLASSSRGFEANMILSRLRTNIPSGKKGTCHKTTIAD